MPTELPKLPAETRETLLTRGMNTHLPIVAGEVAEYARRGPLLGPAGRMAVLIGLLALTFLIGIGWRGT